MKYFAFGIGPNGGVSGGHISPQFNERAKAEEWAATILGKHAQISSVHIVQGIAICERQASPIKVTELTE